ncbi:MAG: hypothetical protein CMJ77_01655 [Planctomycetaceae bacterium]|nr:hypothetical protein [Planctomycetaceae bacterium]
MHWKSPVVVEMNHRGAAAVKRGSIETVIRLEDAEQQAASLLNQQIWCWGQDILSSKGDLLVQHGFLRTEKPAGSNFASLYRLELSPESRVILRGFGVFFGDNRWGGVFLRRFVFKPQLTPSSDCSRPPWSVEDLPPLVSPREDRVRDCQHLLLELIDWIHQYESWIAEQAGLDYRAETLLPWSEKNDSVPPEQMADAWQMLGAAVSDHPEYFIP